MRKIYFLIIISQLLAFIACDKTETMKISHIKGNIDNLPNGTIYLYKDYGGNFIDSCKTINGKFEFIHKFSIADGYSQLGLDHKDEKDTLRAISFPTNAKKFGTSENYNTNMFMSDEEINITGSFEEVKIKALEGTKLKFIKFPKISGRQTDVMLDVDMDLFQSITPIKKKIITEKVEQYPYSFFLLQEVAKNKNSFSVNELQNFINHFEKDKDIKNNILLSNLKEFLHKKQNSKDLSVSLLANEKGEKEKLFNPKYQKHLVVFWASWCGPCRKEIPILKEYHKQNPDIEIISISTDKDKNAWQKALKQEKMSWRQLIAEDKDLETFQFLYQYNGAIPYVVLVDANGKLIKKSEGLKSEKEFLETFR